MADGPSEPQRLQSCRSKVRCRVAGSGCSGAEVWAVDADRPPSAVPSFHDCKSFDIILISLTAVRRVSSTAVSVPIIRRAGPFGGNHRGAQRTLGRAADAEGRAVVRLAVALEDLAGDALGRLLGRDLRRRRTRARRRTAAYFSRRPRPLAGNLADAAPLPRHHAGRPRRSAAGPRGCPRAGRCGRTGSRPRPGPASSCRTHMQHALQDVHRLEARDHDRHAILVGDRPVLVHAHHRADVARRPGSPARGWRASRAWPPWPAARARATPAPRSSSPQPRGLDHGHRVGRGGGLEADGEEHHLPLGCLRARATASIGE